MNTILIERDNIANGKEEEITEEKKRRKRMTRDAAILPYLGNDFYRQNDDLDSNYNCAAFREKLDLIKDRS